MYFNGQSNHFSFWRKTVTTAVQRLREKYCTFTVLKTLRQKRTAITVKCRKSKMCIHFAV